MDTEPGNCDAERPLRRDAARNRELILETAAAVFAEHGLEAGYEEIARRAGIGVGTVYRRFPERAELVRALFESQIEDIVAIAEQAAEKDDAFAGLAWFLEQTLAHQVADRGLQEVMVGTISQDEHRMIGRERLSPILEGLIARAQADGTLRADVGVTDLGMQLMVMSSMSTPAQPGLWRRYLALLLDGLRARPGLEPLPLVAPDTEATYVLMCNLQRR